MTFLEYWNFFKMKFKYGIDYIDVDACDYIAICVATFDVMNELRKSGIGLIHCTTINQEYLVEQFKNHALNKKEKGIKVFYFFKKANIDDFKFLSTENRELEFCGWVKPNTDKRILYHFCDVRNTHAKSSEDEIAQWVGFAEFTENNGFVNRIDMWRYPDMTLARKAIKFSYAKIISEVEKNKLEFFKRIEKDVLVFKHNTEGNAKN